jgi:hypothetical protein
VRIEPGARPCETVFAKDFWYTAPLGVVASSRGHIHAQRIAGDYKSVRSDHPNVKRHEVFQIDKGLFLTQQGAILISED